MSEDTVAGTAGEEGDVSIYCPSRGGRADGVCGCGVPATTEFQCGVDRYEEMCEACYDRTEEAAHYRHEADVRRACEALAIPTRYGVRVEGYAAHTRAAEILAWIKAHPDT